jgi:hypothetical protein
MIKIYSDELNSELKIAYSINDSIANVIGIYGQEKDLSNTLSIFYNFFEYLSTISDYAISYPGTKGSNLTDLLMNVFFETYTKPYKLYYNFEEINSQNKFLFNQKVQDKVDKKDPRSACGQQTKNLLDNYFAFSISLSTNKDPILPFQWYSIDENGKILNKYNTEAEMLIQEANSTNNIINLYIPESDFNKYDFFVSLASDYYVVSSKRQK